MKNYSITKIIFFLLIFSFFNCSKKNNEVAEKTKTIDISGDLNFGVVTVNSSSSRALTIKNTGTSSVNIKSISCPEAFSVDWLGGSVAGNNSKEINVRFLPTTARSYSGEILIESNAGSGTNKIQVSGTGELKSPKLSVSNTSLNFGDVTVNNSATQTFTITNTGNAPLTINSITTSSAVFSFTFNTSIPEGGSQQISVKFSPTAVQSHSGQITINTNGGNATVLATGNGTVAAAPVLSAAPTSLNFGDVTVGNSTTQTFTISNTGNAPLTINSITTSSAAFSLTYNTSVAVGGSQQISVKFAPATVQTHSGQITINTNGGNATVSATGNGTVIAAPVLSVAPTSLNFGDVTVGNSTTQTFTISNTGNAPLTINSITTSSAAFSLTYNTSVAVGGSQQISVKFAPATVQTHSGQVTINTNGGNATVSVTGNGTAVAAPTISVAPTSLNFGDVTIGNFNTQTFTISNTGNAPLTISSITLSSAAFSLNYNTSIAAGSSQQITVKFAPTTAQNHSGQITINSNAGNATVSVTGNGTSVAAPVIGVAPTSLNFGDVTVGNFNTQTFTIYNTGNAPLSINSINSSNNSVFSGSGWATTIPANSSTIVNVKFSPLAAQYYSEQFTITSNAGVKTVSLTGTGAVASAPVISVLPTSLSFGSVTLGYYLNQAFTIYNTGNAPLVINSINSSNNSVFSGSGWATAIPANSSTIVTVKFSPIAAQYYSEQFTITSNAGVKTVNLYGTGVIPCNPVANPTIGYYANCEGYAGAGQNLTLGLMTAAVTSINCVTRQITFRVKRCNGDGNGTLFLSNGDLYIYDRAGVSSYGTTKLYSGTSYQDITITDNNMVGTKTYYAYIYQPTFGWSRAPLITITY